MFEKIILNTFAVKHTGDEKAEPLPLSAYIANKGNDTFVPPLA